MLLRRCESTPAASPPSLHYHRINLLFLFLFSIPLLLLSRSWVFTSIRPPTDTFIFLTAYSLSISPVLPATHARMAPVLALPQST